MWFACFDIKGRKSSEEYLGLAHLFNLSFITCITPSNSWAYVARRHAHTTLDDEFWVQTHCIHLPWLHKRMECMSLLFDERKHDVK